MSYFISLATTCISYYSCRQGNCRIAGVWTYLGTKEEFQESGLAQPMSQGSDKGARLNINTENQAITIVWHVSWIINLYLLESFVKNSASCVYLSRQHGYMSYHMCCIIMSLCAFL